MTEGTVGPTAFVLAGGGTKGSFEAGALHYLVGMERITPDIVTATSAGAVAATVLAQARTHAEFAQRVQEIEDDIVAMTRPEHVFGEQAWLRALKGTALGRSVQFAVTQGTPLPPTLNEAMPGYGIDIPIGGTPSPRAQRRAARKLRRQRQRRMFRMAAGAVHRLPRARRLVRTSGSSVLTLEPLADALRHGGQSGIRPVDLALIARPGLELRLAVVALRAGVLRYVTEAGAIVEEDARTPAPGPSAGPVDLVEGALASASVPLVFPPRHLADDDYVDGGVLQIIPVRAAVQLGATRIIAVVAMPLEIAREERNFAESQAAQVGIRAMGMIGMAERQRENLATALPEGVTLTTIDPIVDVVGLFEVQPGLLRINKDYGWLRAADILAAGDATLVADVAAQTHRLIEARLQAWHLEESLWTAPSASGQADAGNLALLRQLKHEIARVIDRRKQLGFPVPDGCEAWWSDFETHSGQRPPNLPSCPEPLP
ncbi:MAG TPA: patatin-like phospholipase family protein [Acidimicrobiales bacterium]|jgi:predicted acylesterase/phospholipase RssA|nr:patatin-like phospholipase family protein [Acidimicrobiales bacterium]